jgi:hypothetical protein
MSSDGSENEAWRSARVCGEELAPNGVTDGARETIGDGPEGGARVDLPDAGSVGRCTVVTHRRDHCSLGTLMSRRSPPQTEHVTG